MVGVAEDVCAELVEAQAENTRTETIAAAIAFAD